MFIIYFLLGLGITTAHSDYGVSFRAQNFDKTVQNIDKEAYIEHQREKRFVTGYFVPQNLTNHPTWGNLNITRNHTTFTGPSNNSRNIVANENTGYPAPNTGYPVSNTNPGQNYNTTITRPVYPNYNNIIVIPANKTIFNNSNPSGYNVQPVNPVTPGNTPYYPAPNTGYPSNTGNLAPNTRYPVPNNEYPASNTVYPIPNSGYRAPNTGYPASSGYLVPNTGYPVTNTNPGQNYNYTTITRPVYPNYNNIIVRPANKTNFNNSNPSGYNVQPVNPVTPGNTPYYPVPNTGYPSNTGNLAPNTRYPVPNNVYPASNTVYPTPNSGYRAPNTGYPASSGYPVPNTGYPPPSFFIPTANVTGFVPKPNPGFTIHDAVPRNNTNGFNNYGNGFNNTASWENCKCKLPRANSTITKEERSMDACMIVCDHCPAGMKMSAFGVCVEDLDYDEK